MSAHGSDSTVDVSIPTPPPQDSDVEKAEEKNLKAPAAVKESQVATDSKELDPFLVTLGPEDNPKSMSKARRWLAVLVISTASFCVTSCSSAVRLLSCTRH